ncbi:hypothetical protein ES705_22168 [subsurface metagenome]
MKSRILFLMVYVYLAFENVIIYPVGMPHPSRRYGKEKVDHFFKKCLAISSGVSYGVC